MKRFPVPPQPFSDRSPFHLALSVIIILSLLYPPVTVSRLSDRNKPFSEDEVVNRSKMDGGGRERTVVGF